MSDQYFDVVVVGCGPAGATAARFASQRGASVCVMDQRQEIGNPVQCAEVIPKDLPEGIGIKVSRKWVASEPTELCMVPPDGAAVHMGKELSRQVCGYVINREIFDQELAGLAASASATIMLKTTARSLLRRRGAVCGVRASSFAKPVDIYGDVVIGADGFASQMGRWAGLVPPLSASEVNICFQYTLANSGCDASVVEAHLGCEIAPGGYVWVVPKGGDVANVGISVAMDRRTGRTPKDLLDRFISLSKRFNGARPVREAAGAQVHAPPPAALSADGLMICGSAGRLSDPLTGAGIHMAAMSGMFAGKIAARSVECGDFSNSTLAEYQGLVLRECASDIGNGSKLRELLAKMDDPPCGARGHRSMRQDGTGWPPSSCCVMPWHAKDEKRIR